jgi:hypothetical protein
MGICICEYSLKSIICLTTYAFARFISLRMLVLAEPVVLAEDCKMLVLAEPVVLAEDCNIWSHVS